jgi:2-polyprenyl-3-methyl-5-hydroxy-6-metoxy-1,4-benzoquinol methylase
MSCVACKNDFFFRIYDFGPIPLVNNFTKNQINAKKKYRLDIVYCSKCYLVQIKKNVNPKTLFRNYKHISSGSKVNVEHLKSISKLGLNLKSTNILEIGSNDNSLLKNFKSTSKILCGVDPSIKQNLKGRNVHLYKEFFNYKLSTKLRKKFDGFDFIFAINVIPHVKNLEEVIKGVSNLLNQKGFFIMEGVYLLNNIQKGYFDTFYHEHVSTFSLFSLNKLLKKYNLKIIKTKLLTTQGGSFRAHITHLNNDYKVCSNTKALLKKEFKLGLNKKIYYEKLKKVLDKKIKDLKLQIKKKISKIKLKNKKIIALGAPARGVVITNVLNTNKFIDYYVDDSPTKLNTFFPGTNVKVINWKNKNILDCHYFVLLSWNYEKEIIKKILKYKKKDFYFIKIFPKFKIKYFKKD